MTGTSSLQSKLIKQLELAKHVAVALLIITLIEACLKQMTAGCYWAQRPGICRQCRHLKHFMFIFWRRWDNPLRERHKHSADIGAFAQWAHLTVGSTPDSSRSRREWGKRGVGWGGGNSLTFRKNNKQIKIKHQTIKSLYRKTHIMTQQQTCCLGCFGVA